MSRNNSLTNRNDDDDTTNDNIRHNDSIIPWRLATILFFLLFFQLSVDAVADETTTMTTCQNPTLDDDGKQICETVTATTAEGDGIVNHRVIATDEFVDEGNDEGDEYEYENDEFDDEEDNDDDDEFLDEDDVCEDAIDDCEEMADTGECERSEEFMFEKCRKTCGFCGYDDDDEGKEEEECGDREVECEYWAEIGECKNNRSYMFEHCKESCGLCDIQWCKDVDSTADCKDYVEEGLCNTDPDYMSDMCMKSCGWCRNECDDEHKMCSQWANDGECEKDPLFMYYLCQKSCNKCRGDESINLGAVQVVTPKDDEETLNEIVRDTFTYLTQDIFPNETLSKIHNSCINLQKDCVSYAAEDGNCDSDPDWARVNCPLACRQCENLEVSVRCPIDHNAPEALKPGELDKLFEGILTDEKFKQYGPRTISRPFPPANAVADSFYLNGPWVIIFESFLNDEECDRLIHFGYDTGYERSGTVGELQLDGTSEDIDVDESRTSTNAWCDDEKCENDPIVKKVLYRIGNVTGIPYVNYESIQILKYEVGQFYKSHHDFIETDVEFPAGPRILTFYMYLSDVEEGGGTDFTDLNVTVTPKAGKAILWTNCLNEDPYKEEPNTNHEALPVIKGTKFGANAWIHQRSVKAMEAMGC